MPRILFTDSRVRPLMVTIDEAVGPNCPNRRPDVLLVQFLLKVGDESPSNSSWWKVKRGTGIKIDGVFGEHTQSLIRQVQEQAHPGDNRLASDSRVDPIAQGNYYGARTGVLMTMVVLNMIYMQGTGSNDITTMPYHFWWPKDLSPALQIAVSHAA